MSPRRSSRARSAHNPPASSNTNSSSSGSSTSKGERSNRPNTLATQHRSDSPHRSSTVRSESIDDVDSVSRSVQTAESSSVPRRSRRGNDNEAKEKSMKGPLDNDEDLEEEAIEEEVTRCICGHAEYPGPGASVKEQFGAAEPVSEDIGNFFVQCDKCHVWQHGGCIGLTDESLLQGKDEYYCDQCKPEYHKILKSPNGAKSSRYLPLLDATSGRSSPLSSTEGSRKGNSRKTFEQTKRRATMNSRVAYDEDEMLRRAIEESREMGTLGKRIREDIEEQKPTVKRQRTGSSVSSASQRSQSPIPAIEETANRSAASVGGNRSGNKLRGAAAKNNREKELRDKQKEQVAAQRAEAASKRNARSERRRGEDSPPPTPTLSPSKITQPVFVVSKSKVETPPSTKAALARVKGGRPVARRGRLGRNQYSRDLPANGDISDSPMRDNSDDRHADSPRPHTAGNINGESGRSSKAKTHPARTSLNEMKRRVAAILEFVGRMQTEQRSNIAVKGPSSNGKGSRSSGNASTKGDSTPNGAPSASEFPTASLVKAITAGLEEAEEKRTEAAVAAATANSNAESTDSPSDNPTDIRVPILSMIDQTRDFEEMNATEMMETLTKDLVAWQSLYGIYAR